VAGAGGAHGPKAKLIAEERGAGMMADQIWRRYQPAEIEEAPDVRGIFELADARMRTVYIGSSGTESLRTSLMRHRRDRPDPCIASCTYFFRYEQAENNTAWRTRMLEVYQAAHKGRLPPCNSALTDEHDASAA
jgi:hypothetical protein